MPSSGSTVPPTDQTASKKVDGEYRLFRDDKFSFNDIEWQLEDAKKGVKKTVEQFEGGIDSLLYDRQKMQTVPAPVSAAPLSFEDLKKRLHRYNRLLKFSLGLSALPVLLTMGFTGAEIAFLPILGGMAAGACGLSFGLFTGTGLRQGSQSSRTLNTFEAVRSYKKKYDDTTGFEQLYDLDAQRTTLLPTMSHLKDGSPYLWDDSNYYLKRLGRTLLVLAPMIAATVLAVVLLGNPVTSPIVLALIACMAAFVIFQAASVYFERKKIQVEREMQLSLNNDCEAMTRHTQQSHLTISNDPHIIRSNLHSSILNSGDVKKEKLLAWVFDEPKSDEALKMVAPFQNALCERLVRFDVKDLTQICFELDLMSELTKRVGYQQKVAGTKTDFENNGIREKIAINLHELLKQGGNYHSIATKLTSYLDADGTPDVEFMLSVYHLGVLLGNLSTSDKSSRSDLKPMLAEIFSPIAEKIFTKQPVMWDLLTAPRQTGSGYWQGLRATRGTAWTQPTTVQPKGHNILAQLAEQFQSKIRNKS